MSTERDDNTPENPETEDNLEGSFAEQIEADEALENTLNAAHEPQTEIPDDQGINVAALEEQLAAAKDQTLRALAELENFRDAPRKNVKMPGNTRYRPLHATFLVYRIIFAVRLKPSRRTPSRICA